MDIADIGILVMVVFAAGLLQSLSGFGFGLLAVPLLTLRLPTQIVAPLLIILGIVLNAAVAYRTRGYVKRGTIWPLLLAGALFTPLGAYLLLMLPDAALRSIIGVVSVFFAVVLLFGFKTKLKKEWLWLFPIGAMSGLLNGSITLSGPPVVLFMVNQSEPKQGFRAKLAFYFLLLNLVALPSYLIAGIVNTQVLQLSLFGLVPLVAGILIGTHWVEKVSEPFFKTLVLVVVLITGLMALISGLSTLF